MAKTVSEHKNTIDEKLEPPTAAIMANNIASIGQKLLKMVKIRQNWVKKYKKWFLSLKTCQF